MQHKKYLPQTIATIWGFAEASCFFIVPDVFITYRALKGYKAAIIGSLYAAGGALLGGWLMYALALHSNAALDFVRHVPGITPAMSHAANNDYMHHGASALLIAPVRGIPYKLYSVLAPKFGVGLAVFLAISLIARLSRFLLTSLITAVLSMLLGRWLSYKQRLGIHICFWIIFYGLYFYHNH